MIVLDFHACPAAPALAGLLAYLGSLREAQLVARLLDVLVERGELLARAQADVTALQTTLRYLSRTQRPLLDSTLRNPATHVFCPHPHLTPTPHACIAPTRAYSPTPSYAPHPPPHTHHP